LADNKASVNGLLPSLLAPENLYSAATVEARPSSTVAKPLLKIPTLNTELPAQPVIQSPTEPEEIKAGHEVREEEQEKRARQKNELTD
jgi:hypothetical protein